MIETTAVSRPRPPDMIPGYRLDKLVGKGGMGEVHKATQLSLGRTVAVKLLASELAKDQSFVTRFEKEAAALAALSHPNVVSIVDKGKASDTYYLVMEFVDGPSLRELMRSPYLEVPAALRIVLDICRAIDYAHGRGVIHRDLKPENILFDEQAGRIPKVSDFGLAGFVAADAATRFNVTETHVSMGTLSYMAPEQRVDAKSADHRADIYSLGVILYELLVGEVPMGQFDPPSQRKPGLDRRLDAIVGRCLKPIPEDRYAQISGLIADLEPLAPSASFSHIPRKVSRIERLRLRVRRAVATAARVAATMLVVAAVGVLGVAALRASREAARVDNSAALAAELEKSGALAIPGRLTTDEGGRLAAVGAGPDAIPLVMFGRRIAADGEALVFADEAEAAIGRAELDLSEVDGYQSQLVAEVTASPPSRTFWARLGRAITGAQPRPRAALVFEGLPGRFVAVVLPGTAEPISFEWALMERRGAMLGPIAPEDGRTFLELFVNAQGELRVYAGSGKDRRQVGEPVALGPGWRRHFGKMPRASLMCLEGSCRFDRVAFDIRREPPAPPPPPPVVKTVSATSKPTVKKAGGTTKRPVGKRRRR